MGSIPGLGRSPGKRDGNQLQYSSLGNPMDLGASLTVKRICSVGYVVISFFPASSNSIFSINPFFSMLTYLDLSP